jgi:tagatose-1,6-bisphosphate aldolase
MVIKCTFLVSLESVGDYAKQFGDSPPLPEYITKKGPYVNNNEGAAHQIIILYEFDRSELREAWTNILKQMDSLHGVPGLAISAHILEAGKKAKGNELTKETKEWVNRFPHNPRSQTFE